MQVHIANYQKRLGGGWTQQKYLAEGLGNIPYQESDIYFICSASMVQREEVQQAKKDGKKIVLRIDNALRNSRNRGTGMTRMKDFVDMSDLVIYQSQWAKRFLYPFTQKDGPVILNGCDTSRFNTENRNAPDDSYLYVRSSRDEGKGWINAWYWFVNNPGTLEIVGKFSRDNLEYNFDFYNGERYRFMGEQTDMADCYKRNKYFLYTYLNDACSNTAIEALASGCEILSVNGMTETGGMPEIMQCEDLSKERMVKEYRECLNEL